MCMCEYVWCVYVCECMRSRVSNLRQDKYSKCNRAPVSNISQSRVCDDILDTASRISS